MANNNSEILSGSELESALPEVGGSVFDPLSPDWEKLGLVTAYLILSWRSWLVQRVERLEFENEVIQRREVTVDFVFPGWLEPTVGEDLTYLPLTRLPKQVRTNFDVTDEHGLALSPLTDSQSEEISANALLVLAEALVGRPVPELEKDIRKLVARDETYAKNGRVTLLDEPIDDEADARTVLREQEVFRGLVQVLATQYVLYLPMRVGPSVPRLVRFSYNETISEPHLSWSARWTRLLGWRGKDVWFQLPAFADAPSFHVQLEAPGGLQIRRRRLVVVAPSTKHKLVGDKGGAYSRAHLYHEPGPGERAIAWLTLRPRAATIVRATVGTALLACALLAAMFVGMVTGALTSNTRSAAALLLFVPGVLSLFINRSEEHPLATELLIGIRVLAWAPGVCALAGATLVAVARPERPGVQIAAGALVVIAFGVLFVAGRTWLRVRRTNWLGPSPGRVRLLVRDIGAYFKRKTGALIAKTRELLDLDDGDSTDEKVVTALEEAGVLEYRQGATDQALMVFAWKQGGRPARVVGTDEAAAVPSYGSDEGPGEALGKLEAKIRERNLTAEGPPWLSASRSSAVRSR